MQWIQSLKKNLLIKGNFLMGSNKNSAETLLEVKDLKVTFQEKNRLIRAVDGVDLAIEHGEIFGIIGESGSGKSVTGLSIMKLFGEGADMQASQIKLEGQDLMRLTEKEMRHIRGNKISMIFQDPMTSLNPAIKIGKQIEESLIIHKKVTKSQAEKRVLDLMNLLAIPNPLHTRNSYPHEFSGGMRQRVMIAMALICDPVLLIADEPTTALDVTIQAQIMDLMQELVSKLQVSILIITHDFGVVAEMCKRVSVMYAGQIVEHASVNVLLKQPLHPYSKGLLECIIHLDDEKPNPKAIPGQPPDPARLPKGCRFSSRCKLKTDTCLEQMPELKEINPGHFVRCFHHA
jgi:oligopeptide/dipeptide ABC transporter ATP-binding protein